MKNIMNDGWKQKKINNFIKTGSIENGLVIRSCKNVAKVKYMCNQVIDEIGNLILFTYSIF